MTKGGTAAVQEGHRCTVGNGVSSTCDRLMKFGSVVSHLSPGKGSPKVRRVSKYKMKRVDIGHTENTNIYGDQ